MAGVIDEGLCLRAWDWSETSQTAMVFARGLGLVRGLAKGAKRPKHPYSGGLEMLSRGRVGVIVRPTSELALLTSWDLCETFPALRQSLAVHNAGLFIADALQHAIRDHDPHEALYDQTIESLRLLAGEADDRAGWDDGGEHASASTRIAPAMLKFLWAVLLETGYKPELNADVRTGELLDETRALAFIPGLGGFGVIDAERATESSETPSAHWRTRSSTLAFLRHFAAGGLQALAVPETSDPATMDRVNRLLASYLRYVLGTEPPTMTLVFGSRLAR
ncbi:MAG: DNA repair protein RecO [Phycisphaerales bacterium]|nr:DNA repair protein RecO [Phycisphaerales bacterium]